MFVYLGPYLYTTVIIIIIILTIPATLIFLYIICLYLLDDNDVIASI